MDSLYLGKCRYCGADVPYEDGQTFVKCTVCGERLVVTDFLNEQIRISQIQDERDKALEDLKNAEKEKKEAEQRLYQMLSDMGKAETAHAQQQELLEQLKEEQSKTGNDLGSLIGLTEALQDKQNQASDFLGVLYGKIAEGQSSAEEKLSALQAATKILQSSDADLQKKIDDIEGFLKTDAAEKAELLAQLKAWLQQAHAEDNDRLDRIREACDRLEKENEQRDRRLQDLKKNADETKLAIDSFEKHWRTSELNKITQLYRQAESYQFERRFDKAEDYYRQALVAGANDPEIYWRIVMCHYCLEYQVDNEGNRIPSILYPDLRDPSEIEDRRRLENSYQNEEQKAYYTEQLQAIDRLLEKYRKLCDEVQYDVFISVKQKDNGKYTPDCGKAYDLYRFIRDDLKLRVFNSEQTKPKAGEEFEPYILAALLSSRVMIVVGSCREYMEAQWIRNEWSRYMWLQKHEKASGEGKDRRLFCYLVQGMQPNRMPNELLRIQAIEEGVNAKDELKRTLQGIFTEPPRTDPPVNEIIAKWDAWLTLKEFNRVGNEYSELVRRGKYLENPGIHLDALCAEYGLTGVNALPMNVPDLLQNNKFIQADRCAVTPEDKALMEKLKQAYQQELKRRKESGKIGHYAVYSLLSALTAGVLLIALYFIDENPKNTGRDIPVEFILLGGAAVLVFLSFLLFRSLHRLSVAGQTEAGPGTRMIGLVHLCISLFGAAGVFFAGETDWNGWILGKWAYYYADDYYRLQLTEVYILAGAFLLSAVCAALTIFQKKAEKFLSGEQE